MKSLLSILLLTSALLLNAQVAPDKYFVKFSDKNNSPYSIDQPEEFLTQRAIDRRDRYDIEITEQDIPVNPGYLDGVAATGAQLLNATKWLNGVTIYTDDPAVLDAISELPYVEGTYKASHSRAGVKPKPFFASEYIITENYEYQIFKSGNELDYGGAYNQIEMLNGIPLHNNGYRGQGMVIAVLDAGFMNADYLEVFDTLWNNNRILGSKDFVDHSGTVYDYSSHGTSVLSTMGGYIAGELIGTAPDASYWLLRSEESINGSPENLIEEYNWVSAAEFADSVGADLINSSLGYTEFDDPEMNHTYEDLDGNTTVITRGADIAANKGILVVNSAGNSGGSLWYYVGAPADGDSVFSIGAVTPEGELAGFSSHGPTSDGRIKPNVVGQGAPAHVAFAFGGYGGGYGTSFSSPVIAGMTACLWQAHPWKTNYEIMMALQQSASLAGDPNNDMGYGIPDYNMAFTILSVNNQDKNSPGLILYPNPVNNRLYIQVQVDSVDSLYISITDETGKLVYSATYETAYAGTQIIPVDAVASFSSGIYFVEVISTGKVLTGKFIK
ncbi:MAG: S8 family serine peptidase [Bacteroidales bacterium]|nr:S8 family serine peptidase [Bacteroidales bacterium]MCF8343770.1 S8 family serine peptidase [Bacteroidales bacterium]MCF8351635.1 S8 family serine peptidase [Bacteroidales bacterium]MCF8375237.1 S8 family serine peptidase [Bacteroidales bacterium]MCF8400261.1 S8 family serine peptidase [Bacteroidales bacterium]